MVYSATTVGVYLIIGVVYWLVVFGCGTAWVAGERGRDKITWGIIGFFLGIFALIFLALTPMIDREYD